LLSSKFGDFSVYAGYITNFHFKLQAKNAFFINAGAYRAGGLPQASPKE